MQTTIDAKPYSDPGHSQHAGLSAQAKQLLRQLSLLSWHQTSDGYISNNLASKAADKILGLLGNATELGIDPNANRIHQTADHDSATGANFELRLSSEEFAKFEEIKELESRKASRTR